MAPFWTDLWTFTKAVFRHWRAGVTGGAIAVGSLFAATYYPIPRSVITAALVGYVLVAAFYAWREEHRNAKERTDARHRAVVACFERCIAITGRENTQPFNALVRANAHELETSDEVSGVCVMMQAYGHGDPFTDIDPSLVSLDERLAFVRFFRYSSEHSRADEIAYLDAALEWAKRFHKAVPSEARLKVLMRKILPWG